MIFYPTKILELLFHISKSNYFQTNIFFFNISFCQKLVALLFEVQSLIKNLNINMIIMLFNTIQVGYIFEKDIDSLHLLGLR